MPNTSFHLVTDWSFDAPREPVWRALMAPEEWPSWWRAVAQVERVAAGQADGVGAVRRMTWRTALPYTLTFDMRMTCVEPMKLIEGRAEGDLAGLGRWTLSGDDTRTNVRYEWIVDVTKPWQRTLAPLLRPVFTWNHNVVMGWGYEGLALRFATPGPIFGIKTAESAGHRALEASILITVYNCEAYIEQSVASALAQTIENFEVVVVDDGSTDRTAELLDRIEDRRLKTFHCPRIGRARALNFGLDKCSAPYVAILDADDLSLPTRLRLQTDFLDRNPDVALAGSKFRTFIDADGKLTGQENELPTGSR